MGTKRVACFLGLILPFAFLAFVGIRGRISESDYQVVEYGRVNAERLYAYGPYVKSAEMLALRPAREVTDEELTQVTQSWIDAYADGQLEDVLPARLSDIGETGPKQEILRARALLARKMESRMIDATRRKDYSEASHWAVLMLRLGEVGKFSDFVHMGESGLYQISALRVAEDIAPELSATERNVMWEAMQDTKDNNASLRRLWHHMELLGAHELRERHGDWRPIVAKAKTRESSDVSNSISKWAYIAFVPNKKMDLFTQVNLSLITLDRAQTQLKKTEEALLSEQENVAHVVTQGQPLSS